MKYYAAATDRQIIDDVTMARSVADARSILALGADAIVAEVSLQQYRHLVDRDGLGQETFASLRTHIGVDLQAFCRRHNITRYHLYTHVLHVPESTGIRWIRDGVPASREHMVRACIQSWEQQRR